jgi:hypothetical protein
MTVDVDWGDARWGETLDASIALPAIGASTAVDLPALAEEANEYHAKAEGGARYALEAAWHAGNALIAAKILCEHGEWLGWLAANFKGSVRSAQNYMRLASNTQSSAYLDSEQSIDAAIKALCKTHREPTPPQDVKEEEPTEQKPPENQAEQQDSPAQPKPELKRQSVPKDFSDEVDQLEIAIGGFVDIVEQIMHDERYPRARKRIAKTELPRLEQCVSLLEAIKDELGEGL